MAELKYPPLYNGLQKTLDAQLNVGVTSQMTLNNTTGVQNKPGVVVIDRIDTSGAEKSSAVREYISYTGVSGNNLTGLTRGLGGSRDQDHVVGAIVEFIPDVTVFQAINDVITTEHNTDGTHGAVTATSVTSTGAVTAGSVSTDTVNEKTAGSGVTVDQLLIKDGEINLATGKNIQVNSVDPWRTITIVSGMLKPATTSPCGDQEKIEAGTNDIDYDVLPFDASSDERAYANFQMPDSYDGGVIQFRFIWTNAAGLPTETVRFELKGRAYADSDAIDQACGTAVAVDDTCLAQGDIHISAWSGDVTLAGSPAGGQWVHIEIMRDVSEDNLTGDALLIGIQIRFKQAQYSD